MLVNPNIATIQTSKGMADKTYFLPVNADFVEKVIAREKPDAVLLGFGGQTALNCGVELFEKGILQKHRVQVIGTQVEAIVKTEDRELFVKELKSIGVLVPKSIPARSLEAAADAAKHIGFPLIIRAAFALGGRGSAIAHNMDEFKQFASQAFSHSKQILVEECLQGWKEIEYEVVRDSFDNCITVCNMENLDPLGIHTGESIVVAPSQTLNNKEYHLLREISIKVVRHLGIIGECNIQYALDPKSEEYRVIEVNARLSRSSALASKATGYPLAFVAAKLSLGYSLPELQNSVTRATSACFEPALDYVALKIPKWDLQKFSRVSERIGTEMKSVGEVMAVARGFEEAMQKAIRMLDSGFNGLVCNKINSFNDLKNSLKQPTDKRIFAVVEALKKGYSVQEINALTSIDEWFLQKIKKVVDLEQRLRKSRKKISKNLLLEAKRLGFSDKQLALALGQSEPKIRNLRKKLKIFPAAKQIDTLAGEWPAKTNYLYLTYNGIEDDLKERKKKNIIVLGSGPYRIGSSVEFDWCAVSCVNALKKEGFATTMLNCNPETVSTDYDICDRLYFEEMGFERVLDIYEKEKPSGIILSVGGQIPNNLATRCWKNNLNVLGTKPKDIDRAEDRHKFSKLCDALEIDQPEWRETTREAQAIEFSEKVGFPVLVRPSYVLSGSAMNVAFNSKDLKAYLEKAVQISKEKPVVLSKFITNARELEIDAVASAGKLVCWAITEHVENAGVHSGDATIVLPPQKTYIETIKRIKEVTRKIALALKISGPFNIQFIAKDNLVKVIECNLRASRSFPFVSKVCGTNFIAIATQSMLGKKLPEQKNSALELEHVGVKAPQFSFSRLKGADPILSVEMASTGEVACIASSLEDAFLKSIIATGFKLPRKTILFSLGGQENKLRLLPYMKKLSEAGFELYATKNTSVFLEENSIQNKMLYKIHEQKEPNILTFLQEGKIELVVCVQDTFFQKSMEDEYLIRRNAVDYSVPLLTNRQITELFINALLSKKPDELEVKHWGEYFS